MRKTSSRQTNFEPGANAVPFWRRMAAFVYDGFIIFSLLMLATTIALFINQGDSLLPHRSLFLLYLIIMTGLLLTWCWHRGGQTVGMLAWKIKIVDNHDQLITWKRALLRYILSLASFIFCGVGFIWCLIDKEHQSLHDRLARTKLIKIT